jgi:hypothetical protein
MTKKIFFEKEYGGEEVIKYSDLPKNLNPDDEIDITVWEEKNSIGLEYVEKKILRVYRLTNTKAELEKIEDDKLLNEIKSKYTKGTKIMSLYGATDTISNDEHILYRVTSLSGRPLRYVTAKCDSNQYRMIWDDGHYAEIIKEIKK